jgi:hypothetical protein
LRSWCLVILSIFSLACGDSEPQSPCCAEAPLSLCGGLPSVVPDAGIPATCEAHMVLNAAGLWTNPNSINGQSKPPGALLRADNYTSNRPGEAEPVKGLRRKSYNLPGGVAANALFEYGGAEFAWGSNDVLYHDNGTAYVSNGAAPPLTIYGYAETIKHATGGGDLYVTSANGPLLADGASGMLRTPGVVRALDPGISGFDTASGWLPAGSSVAYRFVWGRNDVEGRPIFGAPSGRIVATAPATGGPFAPIVSFSPAPGITTTGGYFYRLYRTAPVSGGVDPGDTMFLVYEMAYTSAGQATIRDVDSQGGVEALFTNGDRGGQTNNRNQPPIAHDLTTYANRMWIANTQERQRLSLRLIAPPATDTVIRVGPVNDISVPADTGTVSQRIEFAARFMVQSINEATALTGVTAYYTSGAYDPPGMVTLEANTLSAGVFTVQATNPTTAALFVPNLSTAFASVSDTYPNRVQYSVDGLFYAFPGTNTLSVGAEESPILRIVALRDSLFVFKKNDGLWKITGRGPFYVEQVNTTTNLVAPDSIAVVDNTIFGIADSGVIAVSESGVETVSLPIDDIFKRLGVVAADTVFTYARAVAREMNTELKVYFSVPTDDSSVGGDQTFEYNVATETWWRRPYGFGAGYTDSAGRLVLASPTFSATPGVYVERHAGSPSDYVTDELDPASDPDVVIQEATERGYLVDAAVQVRAGLVLVSELDDTVTDGILEVLDRKDGTLELVTNRPGTLSPGDNPVVRRGIQTDIEWNTEVAVSPFTMKQWTQTSVMLQAQHYGPFPMTYVGDGYSSRFGTVQSYAENEPFVRADVPFDLQRSSRLNIRMQRKVPAEYMRVLGVDTTYRAYGTRASNLKR